MRGDHLHQRRARGRNLDDDAERRFDRVRRQQRRVERGSSREEAEFAGLVEPDDALAPAVVGADELAEGDGVEISLPRMRVGPAGSEPTSS